MAAGGVNGTSSTPPGGAVVLDNAAPARTVTDTNGKLSTGASVANYATGGAAAGDPGLWYPSQARLLGKTFLGRVILPNTAARFELGVDVNATAQLLDCVLFGATTSLFVIVNGTAVAVGAYSATTYDTAQVMRSVGMYFFIKGGAFTNWTLLWMSAVGSAAGLPGAVAETAAMITLSADNIRVPVPLYIPTPICYTVFTQADGALTVTDTVGPDSQVTPSLTWTETTYTVSTNKAINTPTLGADVIVNGGFAADTDWSKGAGWTIAAGTAVATAATSDLTATVAPLTTGTWYQVTFTQGGFGGGTANVKLGTTAFPTHGANGTFTEIGRATSTAFAITGVGLTDTIDNVSCLPLTLASLFASVVTASQDVMVDVNIVLPGALLGIPAGLVINLDSAATPANFVVAYLDGNGNAKLDQCVSGTYTNKISATVTYVSAATLRVIKNGTSYSLFYNNLAVGAVTTISQANINNNLLHGLFAVSPTSLTLDNFQILDTGTTTNAHSALNAL